MLGVVYEVPVPSREPPEEASYQRMLSDCEPGVALITTVPVPQRDPLVAVGAAGLMGPPIWPVLNEFVLQ